MCYKDWGAWGDGEGGRYAERERESERERDRPCLVDRELDMLMWRY